MVPGVHRPVQAPPTQAEETQVAGAPQVPVASHVSIPLLEHCLAPGAQDPVHAPLTHA